MARYLTSAAAVFASCLWISAIHAETIEDAKLAYRSDLHAARTQLNSQILDELQLAKGEDLDLAIEIALQQKAFIERGEIPTSNKLANAVSLYKGSLAVATLKLRESYDLAKSEEATSDLPSWKEFLKSCDDDAIKNSPRLPDRSSPRDQAKPQSATVAPNPLAAPKGSENQPTTTSQGAATKPTNATDKPGTNKLSESASESSVSTEGENGKKGGRRALPSKVQTMEDLDKFLSGTTWKWGDFDMVLDTDHYVRHPQWAQDGVVVRWEAIDRRTVLLVCEQGRSADRYAILMFAGNLKDYGVYNFDGATRLPDRWKRVK